MSLMRRPAPTRTPGLMRPSASRWAIIGEIGATSRGFWNDGSLRDRTMKRLEDLLIATRELGVERWEAHIDVSSSEAEMMEVVAPVCPHCGGAGFVRREVP